MTVDNNIFTETPVINNQETETPVIDNAYETLVGEGRKYQDNEALAKAAIEKDRFIERLKQEQAEARKELEKRMTIDEFMNKLEQKRMEAQASNTETPSVETPTEVPQQQGLTPEAIEKLLEEKLQSQTAEQRRQSNLEVAIQEVSKVWGDEAQVRLNQRASELGVSVQRLKEHAMENPKVFLSMVGATTQVPGNTGRSVFQSTQPPVNQGQTGGVKNKAYYDKLRKENPSQYLSPSVQNEMHRQALKLKEKFFE